MSTLRSTPEGLLGAVVSITEGLELPQVLRRVILAAAAQTGAPYAALGVLGPDGLHETFIHTGVDDDLAAAIGELPRGHGVLGFITREEAMVRVDDISHHPASVGFPTHHPAMGSFLGVPLKVRNKVFGNLYLADKPGGFDDEDEAVVRALAAAAAVAIENARLHARVRARGAWLAAAQEITTLLLRGEDEEEALLLVARRAREVAGAALAALVLPSIDGSLIVELAETADVDTMGGSRDGGVRDGGLIGGPLPVEPIVGRTDQESLETPGGWIVDDLAKAALTPGYEEYGPAMFAPLADEGSQYGVLLVARHHGSPFFTTYDLRTAMSFASQAAVALRLAAARDQADAVALLDERQRIARDLHDLAVQQLFASGMQLARLKRRRPLDDAELTRVLDDTLAGIDSAVTQIRATIRALHGQDAPTLVERLRRVTSSAREALGFAPSLVVDEAIDGQLDEDLEDDITAVTREALSNVARHAKASSAEVHLDLGVHVLTLSVDDDGIGIDAAANGLYSRRSGLANYEARARRHSGSVTVSRGPRGGTRVVWQVPLA